MPSQKSNHLLRVTTYHQAPKSRRWYASSTQDYWLEPARVVKSPMLLSRDPDTMEEVDRALVEHHTEKVEGEREWIAWYALPWYKRMFKRRPFGYKPLFKNATMDEVLSNGS
jgi:hypothetical protein